MCLTVTGAWGRFTRVGFTGGTVCFTGGTVCFTGGTVCFDSLVEDELLLWNRKNTMIRLRQITCNL